MLRSLWPIGGASGEAKEGVAQPGEKGDTAPRPVDAIEAQHDADGKKKAGAPAGKEEDQRQPTRPEWQHSGDPLVAPSY